MSHLKLNGTVKGIEVLHFPCAEVEKVKDSNKFFNTTGGLSVLYFSDYHRYVLQINDWKYPLVRRLPIIAFDKSNLNSRTYMLPSNHGFAFVLKLENIQNIQILSNFESILMNNSRFSYQGESSFKKVETSPDDKLYRHKISPESGIFEKITGTLKSGFEKIKHTTESLSTGTKNLTSRKKRINLKDIKNKNFRRTAHSSFKKDFFESNQKLTVDFLKLRSDNSNHFQSKQLSDLTKGNLPSLYVFKEDLENFILNNKELAASGKVSLVINQPKSTGLSQSTTSNLTGEIGRQGEQFRGREVPSKAEPKNISNLEGMTNYSG